MYALCEELMMKNGPVNEPVNVGLVDRWLLWLEGLPVVNVGFNKGREFLLFYGFSCEEEGSEK